MFPVVEAPWGRTPAPPPAPPDGPEQGVIEEARRRQRNRRGVLTGIAAAVILAAALTHLGAGGAADKRLAAPRGDAATPSPPASSSPLFSQPPYMGVACGVPNSIACDRVGLAVWLRRPAVSVDATIAGRRLKLDDPNWSGRARNGRRTMLAGFLQPAGLAQLHVRPDASGRWYGVDAPAPSVRLWIHYGHGRYAVTRVSVLLTAGWG